MRILNLFVVELDTRVRCARVRVDSTGGGETLSVLIEDNIALIFDKLFNVKPVRSARILMLGRC